MTVNWIGIERERKVYEIAIRSRVSEGKSKRDDNHDCRPIHSFLLFTKVT